MTSVRMDEAGRIAAAVLEGVVLQNIDGLDRFLYVNMPWREFAKHVREGNTTPNDGFARWSTATRFWESFIDEIPGDYPKFNMESRPWWASHVLWRKREFA